MKNLILGFAMLISTATIAQYQVSVSTFRYIKNGKPSGQIFDGIAKVGDSIAICYEVNKNMIPIDTSSIVKTYISNRSISFESVITEKSWNYLLNYKWALYVIPLTLRTDVFEYDFFVNSFKIISLRIKDNTTATETPITAPGKEFTFYSILGTNKTTCKFTDLPSGLWVCEGAKYLKQ